MVYFINGALILAGVIAALALLAPAVSKQLGPVKIVFGIAGILGFLWVAYNFVSGVAAHGLPPAQFLVRYFVFPLMKAFLELTLGVVLILSGTRKEDAGPSPLAPVEGPVGFAAIAYAVVSFVLYGLGP